jgi:probable rRNA maturation factor
MSGTLVFGNRQKSHPVNIRLLRRITNVLLRDLFHSTNFRLGIHLVSREEITALNARFLHHIGSTDVITFDYTTKAGPASFPSCGLSKTTQGQPGARETPQVRLHGEIFISIDDAFVHAREFRTTWQSELARYLIHGLLHLQGYDDVISADRSRMKRKENRLLKQLSSRFCLVRLSQSARLIQSR